MSTSQNAVCLITGANKGIGLGLLRTYLARPNVTVVATVRDPESTSSLALSSLTRSPSTILHILKIDNSSPSDAAVAVSVLQTTYHISHLDTVIANAALQNLALAPLARVEPSQVTEHLSVNTVGTLYLFQAVFPLLMKAPQPKFVLLGSPLGSITGMEKRPVLMGAYGVSKAAAHYLVRKIHLENQGLIAFAVDPGFVQTESGNEAARAFGMKEARTPVNESVAFLVATIDCATREKTSGHFPSIEGRDWEW